MHLVTQWSNYSIPFTVGQGTGLVMFYSLMGRAVFNCQQLNYHLLVTCMQASYIGAVSKT